ncbi:hypothetical protein LNV08_05395 [Paucibacter sp. TC2R-5]|uniref:hypothetical protein n=1 Tax=Paucibacter sp. TC2R-5 TaxID=2893555 RepID=UPI0021E35B26|nr:hypothetical protein [Paucibacter sp. TC2R-5]MCV2358404.1 hypothetical protein [Paucibacter sp. TC2R-5]
MLKTLKRALLLPVRLLLALLILFEEWGYQPLARLMARLGRLPVLRQLEDLITRLPPAAALAVLLLPALLLLPVKLLALLLIGSGRFGLGLSLVILAKLAGTAIVARLFQLTRPALLRMAWFARCYASWTIWKSGLLSWLRASEIWRWGRLFKRRLRRFMRA